MTFNSHIFLLLFLPLCLIGYHLLVSKGKGRAAKLWLIAFSLWFYAAYEVSCLLFLAVSVAVNYLIGKFLYRRKALLILGVLFNLTGLVYFKYTGFLTENINNLFGTDFLFKGVLLPLGISFLCFQQIAWLTDLYRGETKLCSFADYILFCAYFPKMSQGPIVLSEEMICQFEGIGKEKLTGEDLLKKLYQFLLGLSKKVLIADTLAAAVDYGYGNVASLSSTDAILTALFFALQLYFDFSGYCDMAEGISGMLGISLPVNFDSPYKASDLIGFWKGWHATLNRFFLRYVYIPLGGNRKGKARMYVNLMIIFLLSGLWHGAGWNFLVWGAMHGVLYAATRAWKLDQKKSLGVPGTFLYVTAAWVFFRAESVSQALLLFGKMFTGGLSLPAPGIYEAFNLDEFWYVIKVLHLDRFACAPMLLMFIAVPILLWQVFFGKNARERAEKFAPTFSRMMIAAVLFLWCLVSVSGVSSFIYVNF